MASISGWRVTRAGIIFAVIVVVLGLLVYGVAAYVQQRGEQVRREEAAKIAQENLDEQSDNPVVIANDTSSEPTDEGDAAPTQTSQPASQSDSTRPAATSQPEALPETGSEVAPLLAIVALTAATAFFVVSRRAVHQL